MRDLWACSLRTISRNQDESGAYVACPEFPPYRYCWLRDGAFIAYGMDRAAQHESSRRFYDWVDSTLRRQTERIERAISLLSVGIDPKPHEMPPTRYTLAGDPAEDDWPNFQLDGYGTWLWGLSEHIRMTKGEDLLHKFHDSISLTVGYLSHAWSLPNNDCWEENGGRVHPATLACLYGGLTAINRYLLLPEIARVAADIREYVLTRGVISGHFVKSIGDESVDASLLWIATPFGLVAPDDPLMTATVAEIECRLLHLGVHRYQEDTYYGGGEWLLLTAWLAWHYARLGRRDDALKLLAWIESCATPEGDLPEQVLNHVNDPAYIGKWRDKWGAIAVPLLWSHAMYLILADELKSPAKVDVAS